MKYLPIKLAVLAFIFGAQSVAQAQTTLESLYRNGQYFELRNEVAKRSKDQKPALLFYRGLVANRFNQIRESIEFMQQYLRSGDTSHIEMANETLADNYLKTFVYGKAADTYKYLLDRSPATLDADRKEGYENSFGLWNALRTTPRQEVVVDRDPKIQGTRDKANLLNVPVEIGGQKLDFVFDTGANLSTITTSTANKLKLKLIESSVSVGSLSGISVTSKLAVAPTLAIGKVILKNVVFLVLDDKSLFFPQIGYQINGIVGFPVMESLGQLTISRTDELSVAPSAAMNPSVPNLCLEELKPLVEGSYNGKKMIFLLDSGAVTSTFYPSFFKANKDWILKLAKPQKIKLGGAGGFKEVKAYILDKLELSIGGKTVWLANAVIIAEPIRDQSGSFAGNLGQDLIKQFARMTLDFRAMTIVFE